MNPKLTKEQADAITEVVSIGACNAATALSQMTKKRVDVNVPKFSLSTIESAQSIFGDPESPVIAVYLKLLGGAEGVILFSFSIDDAKRLANCLLGKREGAPLKLDEMEVSAIKEITTILAGSYLSAMSKMLKMKLLISSPSMTEDMAGAVIDNILIETSKTADHLIVVNTELSIVGEKIFTYFFFIPESESFKKIISVLGVGRGK